MTKRAPAPLDGQLGLFDSAAAPANAGEGSKTAGAAAAPAAGWPAALEGTARAAKRWTDAERALVLEAIRRAALRLPTLTADDVWRELDGAVPVTKGLTGVMVRAKGLGYITQTDRVAVAKRGGEHDHAQRLIVWRSLVCAEQGAA